MSKSYIQLEGGKPAPKVDLLRETVDLQHYVNLDYDWITNCDPDECGGICRCGRFENLRVESLDPNFATHAVKVPEHLDPVSAYALKGLVHHLVKKDLDTNFSVLNQNGYYGEEISGVFLEPTSTLLQAIREFLADNSIVSRVQRVFIAEYGSLLDEVEQCTSWSIEKVKVKGLMLNDPYLRSLGRFWGSNPKGSVLGAALQVDHGFWLVDGYHRVGTFLQDEVEDRLKTRKSMTLLVGRRD